MPAGRGDFEGTLDMFLTLDLAEIGRGKTGDGFRFDMRLRFNNLLIREMQIKIVQGSDRVDFDIGNQSRFGSIGSGNKDAFEAVLTHSRGHGQNAARVPHRALEG